MITIHFTLSRFDTFTILLGKRFSKLKIFSAILFIVAGVILRERPHEFIRVVAHLSIVIGCLFFLSPIFSSLMIARSFSSENIDLSLEKTGICLTANAQTVRFKFSEVIEINETRKWYVVAIDSDSLKDTLYFQKTTLNSNEFILSLKEKLLK